MQQTSNAATSIKSNTNVPAVNMTTLIRQPLLRVQSSNNMEIQTASGATTQLTVNNGSNVGNLQVSNVQNGSNTTVNADSTQTQTSANQSRVTTLILPSRSATNSQFAQRSNAAHNQKQNLVTITRMQSTPTTPTGSSTGSTQILYNANLGLNFAQTGFVHNSPMQLGNPTDVNVGNVAQAQQYVVTQSSAYRRFSGGRQCVYGSQQLVTAANGQFPSQPSVAQYDGQQLQFLQARPQFAFAPFAQTSFGQFAGQPQPVSVSVSASASPQNTQFAMLPHTETMQPSPNHVASTSIASATLNQPDSRTTASCGNMQSACEITSNRPIDDSIKQENDGGSDLKLKREVYDSGEPSKPVKNEVTAKPRGPQDDGLTNLGWLQNPNLFKLSNLRIGHSGSPPPAGCSAQISPPSSSSFCSPPHFRAGAGNSPPMANGQLSTPSTSSHSFTSPSPTMSPNVAQSGPQLVHFASQQMANLAQYGEDTDGDGEIEECNNESELVQITGELERRDASFASRYLPMNQYGLINQQYASPNQYGLLDPSGTQQLAHFASPDAVNLNVGARRNNGGSRMGRQRSAPYGNAGGVAPRRATGRRSVGQPKTRATRKSQQNAAPPTINPRFAAGYRQTAQVQAQVQMQRPAYVAALSHDPLLSAADPRSLQHPLAFARGNAEMPFLGASALHAESSGSHGDQANASLNDEDFTDFLRSFENDENNVDFGDDTEGVTSPDLDLTVHGVGLKPADLMGLSGNDSFDRLMFDFGPLNGSANSGSTSAASLPTSSNGRSTFGGSNANPSNSNQSPFAVPAQVGGGLLHSGSPTAASSAAHMAYGGSVTGRSALNASLNTPNAPLSLSNSMNVGVPFLGVSLSASQTQNMVIDLMNPDELCFNDERVNEQNDHDLLESLDDYALDSILANDTAT